MTSKPDFKVMVLLLVFMQLTRDLFAISKFLFNHILLFPEYSPGTIAVNVTWIEREFSSCQTYCSMYTSIFNRLHAIARYWSEIATFSYPFAFNAPVWSGPWDNRGKCYTDRKRIQCLFKASQHVPIYLQPFPSNSSRKIQRSPF